MFLVPNKNHSEDIKKYCVNSSHDHDLFYDLRSIVAYKHNLTFVGDGIIHSEKNNKL